MTGPVIGFGAFVRFMPQAVAFRRFYQEVLGLPLVMNDERADIFACGDALTEVIRIDGKIQSAAPDPLKAASVPIFRVAGLAALVDRLKAQGSTVLQIAADEAWVLDPAGNPIGMREDGLSPPPVVEEPRWTDAVNPERRAPTGGFISLSWILRRAADPAALGDFYGQVLGLKAVGDQDMDLGRGVTLEIRPGGQALAAPTDRYARPDAWQLRTRDTPAQRRAFRDNGGSVVLEKLDVSFADLAYLADPEGYVIGSMQIL